MFDWILQPWSWLVSGIAIGLVVPALYILAGKAFGLSTSLQHIGAICSPNSNIAYFKDHNWRGGIWNLVFIVGIALGSLIAVTLLSEEPVEFLPDAAYTLGGAIQLLIGGILVGFGTRYAGGCTSGHALTGIANLNVPSLVATIFFFVGGIFVTWALGGLLIA